jgi:hypothetical protein
LTTQRYSVTQPPIETLFTWIRSGEIAIPEIQRPFVWKATQVRDLLDSLYRGFPIGYLITWRNPTVKLKDGTSSSGKRILIDGQQRVTALMAALLGFEVVNKDYKKGRIRIAFHPGTFAFEVSNPAIAKDTTWIPDIRVLYDANTSMLALVKSYCSANVGAEQDEVFKSLESLKRLTSNQIGMIELDSDLEIETVNEIFTRVNRSGVALSQADFVMSKIAVNEEYGGNLLRKSIDYFCHLAARPDFAQALRNDAEFNASDYYPKLAWLKDENDDLYDPSYTDMLRVAFTSQFRRGKMADLVALLSGRNFETKQYEEEIVKSSFQRLKVGILDFMNETHFKRFIMIIKSAGFVDATLIRSQNTLNVAYILYLTLRNQDVPNADIERLVRRWFVMSILTGRYSGSPESTIDADIRQVDAQGLQAYSDVVIKGELSDAFWTVSLPQALETSATSSAYFRLFQAAQAKLGDRGFLSSQITVRELVEIRGDVHHLFPKDYLRKHKLGRGMYNQIANFAVAQSEINIAIGAKEPRLYFSQVLEQCNGGPRLYGNIADRSALRDNYRMNCLPDGMEAMTADDYPDFLAQRRGLMAARIRTYFDSL